MIYQDKIIQATNLKNEIIKNNSKQIQISFSTSKIATSLSFSWTELSSFSSKELAAIETNRVIKSWNLTEAQSKEFSDNLAIKIDEQQRILEKSPEFQQLKKQVSESRVVFEDIKKRAVDFVKKEREIYDALYKKRKGNKKNACGQFIL